MTDKWRPSGWKNPYHREVGMIDQQNARYDTACFDAYEAGADALLEALMNLAKESPTGTFTIDSEVITR